MLKYEYEIKNNYSLGCSQVVRQWTLTPSSVGSNPPIPAFLLFILKNKGIVPNNIQDFKNPKESLLDSYNFKELKETPFSFFISFFFNFLKHIKFESFNSFSNLLFSFTSHL